MEPRVLHNTKVKRIGAFAWGQLSKAIPSVMSCGLPLSSTAVLRMNPTVTRYIFPLLSFVYPDQKD